MKLLITRPEESSKILARRLVSMGHEVVLSPLLEITFRKEMSINLEDVQAFVVTSANGVEGLVNTTQNRDLPLYAVGAKTAQAAQKSGFKTVLSADGDLETLAALIRSKAGKSEGVLLHAGGARLAGDLESLLERSGFQYRREILYDAIDADNLCPDAIQALKAKAIDGVLIFSPHTAKIFTKIVEQNDLSPHLKEVTAWCLSNNVAVEIAKLPFRKSYIAPSPTEASLLGQLTVKAENLAERDDVDTDRIRGQIVSKTLNEDKMGANGNPSKDNDKASDNKDFQKSASELKKPLPDALTGKADDAQNNRQKKKSNAGKIALALFVFFCLGVAAWPLLLPQVHPYLPIETRDIIQGYLGSSTVNPELETRISKLEKSVSTGASSPQQANLGPITATLEETLDQIGTLNGKVSSITEDSNLQQTKMSDRLQATEDQNQSILSTIDALKEQLVVLQTRGTPAASESTSVIAEPAPEILASLSSLQKSLDKLKTDLVAVRQDLSSTETDTEAQKEQLSALSTALQSRLTADAEKSANGDEALVLLALGQLHRESRNEQPFENALHQSLATAPATLQPELATLGDIAKTGAIARRDLITHFSAIANDITQASRLPASDTWYGKTLHNIASMVKFRRVDDVTGTSVDAVVASAEEKLSRNDFESAVTSLKTLQGEPAIVARSWIADAEKRILVDRVIANLLSKATAMAVQVSGTDK